MQLRGERVRWRPAQKHSSQDSSGQLGRETLQKLRKRLKSSQQAIQVSFDPRTRPWTLRLLGLSPPLVQ